MATIPTSHTIICSCSFLFLIQNRDCQFVDYGNGGDSVAIRRLLKHISFTHYSLGTYHIDPYNPTVIGVISQLSKLNLGRSQ